MLGVALTIGLGGELEFTWWMWLSHTELPTVVCLFLLADCSRNDSLWLSCLLFAFCFVSTLLCYLKGDNKTGARRAAPATPGVSSRANHADLCAAVCHSKRKPHVGLVTAEASCEHERGDSAVQGMRYLGVFGCQPSVLPCNTSCFSCGRGVGCASGTGSSTMGS